MEIEATHAKITNIPIIQSNLQYILGIEKGLLQ